MSDNYTPNFDFLDDDEKELEHLDTATTLPAGEVKEAIEVFRAAARTGTSRVISLRVDNSMLARLRIRAEHDGLPYQTMIQSILSRYLNGSLVDVDAVKEVVKALRVS